MPLFNGNFDQFTGQPLTPDATVRMAIDKASPGALAGLEPPRFCTTCGRRMQVQVHPMGWTAMCSRHGEISSAELDR